jgi:general secretion pathway protein K
MSMCTGTTTSLRLRARARGAALIIAMVVAALAALVAISLASAQQQWLASVSHRRDQVQAQSLVLAGIAWSRQVLFDDAANSQIDHLGEPWALPLPPTPVGNGSIEGRIVDGQSFLNVNNLADTSNLGAIERRRFERLFARLGVPSAAIDSISDWVDADSTARPNGAEDPWYASQPSPRLAANRPMVRVAELAQVKGFDVDAVHALSPYLVALPGATPLNVNTASAAVLAAAVDGIDDAGAAALVNARGQRPFATIADFRARLPAGATIADDVAYSVGSDYFLVTVRARQGDTIAQGRALLKRGGGVWPTVVWSVVE